MFRIGKLQTIAGCEFRLPCPSGRLLNVARMTAEIDATPRGWESLIAGHPALLIFCIDRFQRERLSPPDGLTQLANWARRNLAMRLLEADGIEAPEKKKSKRQKACLQSASLAKSWRQSDSACDRNRVLYQFMKQQLSAKASSRPIKTWLKCSAAAVLNDAKFSSKKKRRLFRGSRRFDRGDAVSLSTLLAFLQVATENLQFQEAFHEQLQTEKLAALKQLAYGASHEINNPLANIATGAQALLQSESDPDRQRRLANIYGQSMAAHDMISDLMLFAHPPAAVRETVDLRGLILNIVNRAEQKGQRIGVTFGPAVAMAELDRNQISVALEALIRNSFEAIEQLNEEREADVSIRVDQAVGRLRIFVVDNGPGFTAQQSRHMFDPFYSGREAGRGLGFGLSKAYRIVKLHGGDIVVDRNQQAGETTFLIQIPSGI